MSTIQQCPICLKIKNSQKQWVDCDLTLQLNADIEEICPKCKRVVEYPLKFQGKSVKVNKPYRKPLHLTAKREGETWQT